MIPVSTVVNILCVIGGALLRHFAPAAYAAFSAEPNNQPHINPVPPMTPPGTPKS